MATAVDRRSVKLRFQRRIAATLASDGDRGREVALPSTTVPGGIANGWIPVLSVLDDIVHM